MVLPGMSDGRCFTSYVSACDYNQSVMQMNNVSPTDYKSFIQNNAVDLMKKLSNQQSSVAEREQTLCVDLRPLKDASTY